MNHINYRLIGTISGLAMLSAGLVGCDRKETREDEAAVQTENLPLSTTDDEKNDIDPPDYANEPSTNAKTATGTVGSIASAVDQITAARCAREQRCENIGADKKYESTAKCESSVREEWSDDLNARECKGGVVEKELSECLEEIRNEDCNSPFDTLGRVVACRESDICKAMPLR